MPPVELYRFLSSEGAVKSILNRSLRFSTIESLNDPYDMLFGITDLPEDADDDVDFLEAALHLREITNKIVGSMSFSARCNEPTMWAHYAQNYRGMCFVVDPSVLPEGVFSKVKYSDLRPAVAFDELMKIGRGESSSDIFSDRLLTTKSSSWSYEQEYRLISFHCGDEDYDGFLGIPDGFLTKVILGFNCDYTPSNVRSLLDSSGYQDTRIQIARLHPERFEVDVTEYIRVDMGDIQRDEKEKIEAKLKEAQKAFIQKHNLEDTDW